MTGPKTLPVVAALPDRSDLNCGDMTRGFVALLVGAATPRQSRGVGPALGLRPLRAITKRSRLGTRGSVHHELCMQRPGCIDAFQDIDHVIGGDAKRVQTGNHL